MIYIITTRRVENLQRKVQSDYNEINQTVAVVQHWHRTWLTEIEREYQHQQTKAQTEYQPQQLEAEHEYQRQKTAIVATYHEQQDKAQQVYQRRQESRDEEKHDFERTWQLQARAFLNEIDRFSPPWTAQQWATWQPVTDASPVVRLGYLSLPLFEQYSLPVDIPGEHALFFSVDGDTNTTAAAAMQSLILRLLATIPPGQVQFTFIDPVGLGNHVASFMRLADHDDSLVTSRAWTEPRHIEQRLANLTEHMETIIQKYLRNEYQTIKEYNKAGEIAQPYQVLVVFDFPVNFSEDAAQRLVSIAQNGPRCGVFAIILHDRGKERPYRFDIADLERVSTCIRSQGQQFLLADNDYKAFPLTLETLPDSTTLVNHILDTIGASSKQASTVEVSFQRLLPQALWPEQTISELTVPIGRSGAKSCSHLPWGRAPITMP
ncbi:MAG: hypothetical protein HC837_18855 [Chloroflexaceae bacterium]|nr:hypothetical protein [Chloroflexaceae bacterium]